MSPDDPRHGTDAGAQAHRVAGEEPCEACRFAQFRTKKVARLRRQRGVLNRIRLGEEAHKIVQIYTPRQLSKATGISEHTFQRIKRQTADMIVRRDTRDAILAARPAFSAIGVQRRLRALVALGYSVQEICAHLETGSVTHTSELLNRQDVVFVRDNFGRAIVKLYESLENTPPANVPPSAATRSRSRARAKGWRTPAAWDDIDRDDAPADRAVSRGPGNYRTTLEDFDDLVSLGESEEIAAERLGVRLQSIHAARTRQEREVA